jgi:hypothetical protein
LQAFLKVAEGASHTAAGEQLDWSQSTISRYIKRLEEWLGKELFIGFAPPVLTKHGRAFLPVATDVLELLTKSRTQEAANRKRPVSPALAKERARYVLKFLFKHGPRPGTKQARESGLSDEFLKQARREYLGIRQEDRRRTISGADIDMSFYTDSKANE